MGFKAHNFIESTEKSVKFCGQILCRILPELDEKCRKYGKFHLRP